MSSSYSVALTVLCICTEGDASLVAAAITVKVTVDLRQSVPWFDATTLLQVPKGNYVEMDFTIYRFVKRSSLVQCTDDEFLEVRDGRNESANLLGIFCELGTKGVVRSSGRYMWLKFSTDRGYNLFAYYSGKVMNETGRCIFLNKNLHYKGMTASVYLELFLSQHAQKQDIPLIFTKPSCIGTINY